MKLAIVTLACATQLPFCARPQKTSLDCKLADTADCLSGCNVFAGGISKCKNGQRIVYFDFDGTIEQKDALAHDVFDKINENTDACFGTKGPADKTKCAKAFSVTRNVCTVENNCHNRTNKKTNTYEPCYTAVDNAWLAATKKTIEVDGKQEPLLVGTEIMLSVLDELRAKGDFVKKYFEDGAPNRAAMMKKEVEKLQKTTEVNVLSASWAPIPGKVWRQYLADVTSKDLKIKFDNIFGIDDPGGNYASQKGAVVAKRAKDTKKPIECAVHVDNSFKYARQALALGGGGVGVEENKGITEKTFNDVAGTDWDNNGKYKTGVTCDVSQGDSTPVYAKEAKCAEGHYGKKAK